MRISTFFKGNTSSVSSSTSESAMDGRGHIEDSPIALAVARALAGKEQPVYGGNHALPYSSNLALESIMPGSQPGKLTVETATQHANPSINQPLKPENSLKSVLEQLHNSYEETTALLKQKKAEYEKNSLGHVDNIEVQAAYLSACNREYESCSKSGVMGDVYPVILQEEYLIQLKENDVNADQFTSPSSLSSEATLKGEIKFLQDKLNILDFSLKVTELYQQSECNMLVDRGFDPVENVTAAYNKDLEEIYANISLLKEEYSSLEEDKNKIEHELTSFQDQYNTIKSERAAIPLQRECGTLRYFSGEQLESMARVISNVNSAKGKYSKTESKVHSLKYIYKRRKLSRELSDIKVDISYNRFILESKINNGLNNSIVMINRELTSKENEISSKEGKLSDIKIDMQNSLSRIKRFDIEPLTYQNNIDKENISGAQKIKEQLSLIDKLPFVSSPRKIDEASGLYHEEQFEDSGTCLLHSINHYLAANRKSNNKPFLPLTPKRLELLINAAYNNSRTEFLTGCVDIISSPSTNLGGRLSAIVMNQQKGFLSLKKAYLENDYIADYNYGKVSGSKNEKITHEIGTGFLQHTGVLDFILNKAYGLDEQLYHQHTSRYWLHSKDILTELEGNYSQLQVTYHDDFIKTGHAMNFSKIENKWYLQDSHYSSPIPCSPGELIAHLNRLDDENSHLNIIPGGRQSFRAHHGIGAATKITFRHYS